MSDSQQSCVLLIDNGSVRTAATLRLRSLADALTAATSTLIHPVSLRHADKVESAALGGVPAQVFNNFMQAQLAAGQRAFIVLPLFFGHSKALTAYIPEQTRQLKQTYGDFELQIADVLYPLPGGEPLLVEILHEYVTTAISESGTLVHHVVLVDHGSPTKEVTQVRQELATHLQKRSEDNIIIEQAVMERRKGKTYDFNGDLLEDWLVKKAEQGVSGVVVALLFSLPGRHAGEDGDIETICERVVSRYPEFNITITPLVSQHSTLLDILSSRLLSVSS